MKFNYGTVDIPDDLEELASGLYEASSSLYFSRNELMLAGFRSVGKNVEISRKCSLYNIDGTLGHNVRIDDFCILKGRVEIGNYVHLAAYCMVSGTDMLAKIEDFVGVAARLSLFTGSDDYSADTLGNPTVPEEWKTTIKGPVTVGFGTMIGSHVVILPNVRIGDACSVGAGSVVHRDMEEGSIMRAAASQIIPNKKRDVSKVRALGYRLLAETVDG